MELKRVQKIVISIIVCLSLGFLSGFLSGSAITDWYTQLIKPPFQPPNWVFGPAWTILYILMGIAFGIIWSSDRDNQFKKVAMNLFVVQFILNLIWSPVFFLSKQITLALIVILILWLLIIFTIRAFSKIDRNASYLLIPYLLWVSFATLLNGSIVYLN